MIHLVGWALPLGLEISPSLQHSWVRPVTPAMWLPLRTGPGPLPACQPPSPWLVTHSGPDILGRAQLGRRKPTACCAGEKVHPRVRPSPGPATPLPSQAGLPPHFLAQADPFTARLLHGALPPRYTHSQRGFWAGQSSGVGQHASQLYVCSQRQFFGESEEMRTHIPAPLWTLCMTLGK